MYTIDMDNINNTVPNTATHHSRISAGAVVIIQLLVTLVCLMAILAGMFGMADFTNLKYVVYLVLIIPIIIWLFQKEKSKGLLIGTLISLIVLFALSFVFAPITLLL
jgi:hypothetical protein